MSEKFLGYDIEYMGESSGYYLIIKNGDWDYIQEPFANPDEAKTYIMWLLKINDRNYDVSWW